ncbi:hypothetical protein LPC_1456 [Legionella pneumophila str. Corby]|nr:hypothetical protein LPC_1456 [Legionella pneumophila str. Corby]ADG25334.1 hypothetical protein lpa_02879 [Legionella pneumophila 2300/99 Alcoy]
MFVQINDLRKAGTGKEAPFLKYLAAFLVKNNTDIDNTKIPEDVKE